MCEWQDTLLSEIATYTTGKLNSNAEVENGFYPFFTCSPRTLQIDNYAFDTEALILAGNNANGVFSLKYYNGKFNAYQRTYVISIKDLKKTDYKFLYYALKIQLSNLEVISHGTATKYLTLPILNQIPVSLPPLPEQRAIATVLSSLDDKIDLLHRQNKTLEAMAETLFRQWFVEGVDEGWGDGVLGDVIELFDHLRIPLSKMERDKKKDGQLYPYYGAAKIMDYTNEYIFDGDYILLGEDGTVRTNEGYPVLQYATGKFWVNNHTHVIKAKPPYNNFFLWNYLSKKNIDEIVTGAVQPKINQGNLKALDFPKFPDGLVIEFNEQTEPFFKKMNQNQSQIRTLEKLRDTLLPKLMSGEVRMKSEQQEAGT